MDKLYMDNYLLVLKSAVEVYVHGTLESSNQDVRNVLKKCLDDTMRLQADTYELMTDYNWYTITNVESNCITKVINKVNSN